MTEKYRSRMYEALSNAAEMIRGHVEVGLDPDDVNEEDEKGLQQYGKVCERASKMIETMAKKYESK